jgi:anti-sigma factor ChrR (cupin superfamily)
VNCRSASITAATPEQDVPAAHAGVVNLYDTPWLRLWKASMVRPLRFRDDDHGFTVLLRIERGGRCPRHRGTGDVQSFSLKGYFITASDDLVEPGDFLLLPPGRDDRWQAAGDGPAVMLLVVDGALEILNSSGEVTERSTACSIRRALQKI